MKKRLLIIYTEMVIGGSTTSLLSLLNEIDYSYYDVELLLLNRNGVLQNNIPSHVKIIENNFLYSWKKTFLYYIKAFVVYAKSKIKKNDLIRSQYMSAEMASRQSDCNKDYDVAIAFLEFWPSWYLAKHVKAKKKIMWVHVDYLSTNLDIRHDLRMYESADTIVTVSEACMQNLKLAMPRLKERIVCINNIMSQKSVQILAKQKCDDIPFREDREYVFVTVARIVFNHKGHDRAVKAFETLKKKHPGKPFLWVVIGDGPDKDSFLELVHNASLDEEVCFLGSKINPQPYIAVADFFLLPSRYEGKPIAVTEAQMNGVIPIVTEYASANDQIENGVDGIICENSTTGLTQKLDDLFSGNLDIEKIKETIRRRNYSNVEEIEKVMSLVGGRI